MLNEVHEMTNAMWGKILFATHSQSFHTSATGNQPQGPGFDPDLRFYPWICLFFQ